MRIEHLLPFQGVEFNALSRLALDWGGYSQMYNLEAHLKRPVSHYIVNWEECPVSFSGFFDQDFYLARYPDVVQAGMSPLYHFVCHGLAEGRLGLPPSDFARTQGRRAGIGSNIATLLPHCESLGDNCEFGQVMRHFCYERGGLFRWAGSNVKTVIRFLRDPMMDFYRFDDLVPAATGMVMDTSISIGFHSQMKSKETGSGLEFVSSREERERIHEVETQKMAYLASKLVARLKFGNSLFVVKSQSGFGHSSLSRLVQALSVHEGFRSSYLLIVRSTNSQLLVGQIDGPLVDRTINAWVGKFSPSAHADYVQYDEWSLILSKVAGLNLFEPRQAVIS